MCRNNFATCFAAICIVFVTTGGCYKKKVATNRVDKIVLIVLAEEGRLRKLISPLSLACNICYEITVDPEDICADFIRR